MTSTSPFHTVKAQFGSKEKLIDKIGSKLKKEKDESDSAFRKRLSKVSSRKLLRLAARVTAEKR